METWVSFLSINEIGSRHFTELLEIVYEQQRGWDDVTWSEVGFHATGAKNFFRKLLGESIDITHSVPEYHEITLYIHDSKL